MSRDDILRRLCAFYNRYADASVSQTSALWRSVLHDHHRGLMEALESADTDRLHAHLHSPGLSETFFGIEARDVTRFDSETFTSSLETLAQRIGVLRVLAPGQSHASERIRAAQADIENEVGAPLFSPSCFGYDEREGVPAKLFHYMAVAHTARLALRGAVPRRVLEIGAGIGTMGTIVSAWRCESFTVIDLPVVACLSAYFLSRVYGDDRIWLSGEPPNGQALAHFYPACDFATARSHRYDMVLNVDGFPEYPEAVRRDYLGLVADTLSEEGVFVSCNQEGCGEQNRVFVDTRHHGGLRCILRAPYPLRPGYVEEVYVRHRV